jgi:hypothetical protein
MRVIGNGPAVIAMDTGFHPTNFHLSGSLKQVPVEQMCELVASANCTGMLELAFEGFSAHVFFDKGIVVAADYAGIQDQEAFNQFITSKAGLFEFFPDEKPSEYRMQASVQSLLMEAFRVNDENPAGPAETIPPDFKGIKVIHNTVWVNKNLTSPMEMEFDIACRRLLGSPAKILVIDLTHVNMIISQYLSSLALVAGETRRQDRRLIIRARQTVAQILYRMRFDQLMEIETKLDTSAIPWEE